MSKKTRNIILGCGIVLSLLLVWLRVEHSLTTLSSSVGMFSGLLGYDSPKTYAVLVFDPAHEPLLFVLEVSKGESNVSQVVRALPFLSALPKSAFATSAPILLERIVSQGYTADAVGYINTDAAGQLADAFGGLYIHNTQLTSENFSEVVWGLAAEPNAPQRFTESTSIDKKDLFLNGKALLFVAKRVVANGLTGLYFSREKPFGKSCLGACNSEVFEKLVSSASVEPK